MTTVITPDKKHPAAKTRLADGEHSIDRANVRVRGDLKVLDWRIRLHGDADTTQRRTQADKSVSDDEVKARARRTAEKMLGAANGATV